MEITDVSRQFVNNNIPYLVDGRADVVLTGTFQNYNPVSTTSKNFYLGYKQYELTNHLGNVLAVVSDRKLMADDGTYNNGNKMSGILDNASDFYVPEYQSFGMYYAFGASLPGRSYVLPNSESYRYGFNGQEKDNYISGDGNNNTAEYWQYDTRLGHRWNEDPIDLLGESPYSVFLSNPIYINDPDGDCPTCPKGKNVKDGDTHKWGGNVFTYNEKNGEWSTELPKVTIRKPKPNADPTYTKATEDLGVGGLIALKEAIYQQKLAKYNNNFAKKMWGQDRNGNVTIPEQYKKKFREEANNEAMPAFKAAWASQQSGIDPTSFNYFINPLARAAYLSTRARAVTSRQEGYQLLSQVGFDVALQYVGRFSLLKNDVKYFTNRTQSGGITVLQVKNGKQFRIDIDKQNGLHYHRRIFGPDGKIIPGQGLSRHRPWQKKSTDDGFLDRF